MHTLSDIGSAGASSWRARHQANFAESRQCMYEMLSPSVQLLPASTAKTSGPALPTETHCQFLQ